MTLRRDLHLEYPLNHHHFNPLIHREITLGYTKNIQYVQFPFVLE